MVPMPNLTALSGLLRRRLGAGSTSIFAASLLSMALNVSAGLIVVRVVTPVEYGKISYFLRIFALARFFGTVGLGAKVIEDVSRFAGQGDSLETNTSVYSLGAFRIGTGIGLSLVLVALCLVNHDPVFAWAALTGFLASLLDFIFAVAQGLRLRLLVAGTIVLQPGILVLVVAGAGYAGRASPELIYLTYAASFAGVVPLCLFFMRRSIASPSRRFFSKPYVLATLPAIASLFVFGLLNQLYGSAGILVLGQLKLFEASAFFNAPFSIIMIPSQLGLMLITAVYYPDLVRLLSAGKTADAARLADLYFRGFSIVFALASAAAAVFSDVIVTILYPADYKASIVPLMILSPMMLVTFLQMLFSFGAFALHKTRQASLVLLGLNLLILIGTLISTALGEDVIVLGLSLTYVATSILGMVRVRRIVRQELPFQVEVIYAALTFLLAALSLGIGRAFAWKLGVQVGWQVVFVAGIVGLPLYVLFSFAFLLQTDERESIYRALNYAVSNAETH